MAKDDPRIHHYIPQAYLRGFGWKRGEKQWYVHAYDMKKLRHFQPNIKGVCAQRDFMRVDAEGYDPYQLEAEMSKFEARARESILRVSQTNMFDGDDRTYILNLMALFAVRYPQMRENMRDFQERVLKMSMSLTLAKKERWESTIRKMKEDGIEVDDSITYEKVKEFHDNDQYKIQVPRERHIRSEVRLHETVLQLIANRKWKLWHAMEGHGKFVTSDHPVVLTWDKPHEIPPMMRHSPGFGMLDTEVIFPMTSGVLLVGRFDGEEAVAPANGAVIGYYNTRIIGHCFDFAFSQQPTFPYVIPPDYLFFDDKYLERAKEFHERVAKAKPVRASLDDLSEEGES